MDFFRKINEQLCKGKIILILSIVLYLLAVVAASLDKSVYSLLLKVLLWVVFLGIIVNYFYICKIIIKLFDFHDSKEQSRDNAFDIFLNTIPDAKNIISFFRLSLEKGTITKDSGNYKNLLNEIKDECKDYVPIFFKKQHNKFISKLIAIFLSLILLFATCYVADYVYEVKLSTDGVSKISESDFKYYDDQLPNSSFSYWILNGFYFSVTTVSTVGFGDIHPTTSIKARSIVILEVLTFMLIFTLGFNHILNRFNEKNIYNHNDLMDTLNKRIESYLK